MGLGILRLHLLGFVLHLMSKAPNTLQREIERRRIAAPLYGCFTNLS